MHTNGSTRLLDVTLRDGGYVNEYSWSIDQARKVVRACAAAGVLLTEVGYLCPARHGVDSDSAPAASCAPRYLEVLQGEVCDNPGKGTGLVVMARAKDVTPKDLAGLARFGVRLVRMPVTPHGVSDLGPYAEAVRHAGMAFSVNLIRISELTEGEIVRSAEAAHKISADIFYLADSNGSMFPDAVAGIAEQVRNSVPGMLGFHAHDGISLGFANALAAMSHGFQYIDASLCGMGKGGGNLALELIAAHLHFRGLNDILIAPLVDAAVDLLTPWKGDQILSRCESIVSGILDLNIDNLAGRGPEDVGSTLFSMLDATRAPG